MKKLFTTAAVALFMLSLTSCSDDDSSSNSSSSAILPSKVIEHDGEDSVTSTYTYDGKKLKTIVFDNGDKEVYTYSGDQITKLENYLDGKVWLTDTYTYNNKGQVTEHVEYDTFNVNYERTVFVYNSNGTITTTVYSGDTAEKSELSGTGLITVKDGTAVAYSFTYEGEANPDITTYTFDDKNSPWKNITGMAAIDLISLYGISPDHNTLTETTSSGVTKYTYIYNDAGYPISSVETDEADDSYTTDYIY